MDYGMEMEWNGIRKDNTGKIIMHKIILASGSPRRKELLELLGWDFTIQPAEGEEMTQEKEPEAVVKALSYQKAMEVAAKTPEGSIVIGADTMVALEGELLGKPKGEEAACEMLRRLQGQVHQVHTGVTVAMRDGEDYEYFTFAAVTEVELYPMTELQIREYAATGEPMDKAGAYAIQGIAARYVKGIRGDYNNVVGLPIAELYQQMHKRGLA